MFAQEDDCNILELEIEQYQRGYQNVIDDFQRKLNVRSRDVIINKGRLPTNQPSGTQHDAEK